MRTDEQNLIREHKESTIIYPVIVLVMIIVLGVLTFLSRIIYEILSQ